MSNNINQTIKNWLAVTKEGEFITINKAKDNKTDYFCPCCNEILRARALESECVTPHFYHLQNDNLNSCNYENAYKRYWKEHLITLGEIITVPYLNEITCIELINNYKINDDLTADIYIKTNEGKDIIFFFTDVTGYNFIDFKFDVFYVDFMKLELNKSNLLQCIKILNSTYIHIINNKLRQRLDGIKEDIMRKVTSDKQVVNLNINKFKQLKDELLQVNYIEEYKMIDSVIKSIEQRQKPIYKYKGNIVQAEELNNLIALINKIIYTTKLNINIDLNILRIIDSNIYKGSKWSKCIYFDYIKNISNLLKEHIKQLENKNK